MVALRHLVAVVGFLLAEGIASAQPTYDIDRVLPLERAEPFHPLTDLSFEEVANGTAKGDGASGEHVIIGERLLRDALGDVTLSPPPTFGRRQGEDVVLAIRRNGVPTTTKLRVVRIVYGATRTWRTTRTAIVEYEETESARTERGTVVDRFVAIRVSRPHGDVIRFAFRKSKDRFDELTLKTTLGAAPPAPVTSAVVTELKVHSSGRVTARRLDPCFSMFPPLSLRLTPEELYALQLDWRAARVSDSPAHVSPETPAPGDRATFVLESLAGDGSTRTLRGRPAVFDAAVEARIRPLLARLYEHQKKLETEGERLELVGRLGTGEGGVLTLVPERAEGASIEEAPPVSWHVAAGEALLPVLEGRRDKVVKVVARRALGSEPTLQVLRVHGEAKEPRDVRTLSNVAIAKIPSGSPVWVAGLRGEDLVIEVSWKRGELLVSRTGVRIGHDPRRSPAQPGRSAGLIGSLRGESRR